MNISPDRIAIYVEGGEYPIALIQRTTDSITFTPDDLRRYANYGETPTRELTPEDLAAEDAWEEAVLEDMRRREGKS